MASGARCRVSALAASLLAVGALLPTLHGAWSHAAHAPLADVSLHEASGGSDADASVESCPLCLGARRASALGSASPFAPVTLLSTSWSPHAAPVVAPRAARGASSPRAPPLA